MKIVCKNEKKKNAEWMTNTINESDEYTSSVMCCTALNYGSLLKIAYGEKYSFLVVFLCLQ